MQRTLSPPQQAGTQSISNSSIEICAKPEATGGTRGSIPVRGEKAKVGEGERDSKGPQSPPRAGVTVSQIFCASLGGGQNNIIMSRTPYYHAPKYYHAHDNERGGGGLALQFPAFKTDPWRFRAHGLC